MGPPILRGVFPWTRLFVSKRRWNSYFALIGAGAATEQRQAAVGAVKWCISSAEARTD